MTFKRNNLTKYNIDNNQTDDDNNNNNNSNNIKNVNKTSTYSNNLNNKNIINENKINNNNTGDYMNQIQNPKNDLNPKNNIRRNYKITNNDIKNGCTNNYQNITQNQNNNNIKNNNDNSSYMNNNNHFHNSNYSNNPNNIQGQNINKNNQISSKHPKIKRTEEYYNQKIRENNTNSFRTQQGQQGDKNLSEITNQATGQKNDVYYNNPEQNIKIVNSKFSYNNNSNNLDNNPFKNQNNNRNYQVNQNYNKQNKITEEIGLKTPGNDPLSSKQKNYQFSTPSSNTNANNFICKNCKNNIYNLNINLCQNCFKKEIINEVYSSYLESFHQLYPPEQIINANITITNCKNEKKIFNLDDALTIYNNIFKNEKLERKNIILELKKRICVGCLNEIQNDMFIELPCKCRFCCENHLNNYLSYYKDSSRGYKCRCKILYDRHMMLKLILLKQIKRDIYQRLTKFFIKKLDSICCVCAKTENIEGYVNHLRCLESQEYDNFVYSLPHFFCENCSKNKRNTEFFCQICQFNHFWN